MKGWRRRHPLEWPALAVASEWDHQAHKTHRRESRGLPRLLSRLTCSCRTGRGPTTRWKVITTTSRKFAVSQARPAISTAARSTAAMFSKGRAKNEFPQPPLNPSYADAAVRKKYIQEHGISSRSRVRPRTPRGSYLNPDGMALGQCHYCGFCERFGCEANAKASPDLLVIPLVLP